MTHRVFCGSENEKRVVWRAFIEYLVVDPDQESGVTGFLHAAGTSGDIFPDFTNLV